MWCIFSVRRLDGQRNDADVDGAVFDALQNLVAEIAVDADVHQREIAAEIRQKYRAADTSRWLRWRRKHRALHHVAAVRDDLHGFVAQAQKAFGKFEQNFAGGSELHGFGGAIQNLAR